MRKGAHERLSGGGDQTGTAGPAFSLRNSARLAVKVRPATGDVGKQSWSADANKLFGQASLRYAG